MKTVEETIARTKTAAGTVLASSRDLTGSTGEVANAMDSLFEAATNYEGTRKFHDLGVARKA